MLKAKKQNIFEVFEKSLQSFEEELALHLKERISLDSSANLQISTIAHLPSLDVLDITYRYESIDITLDLYEAVYIPGACLEREDFKELDNIDFCYVRIAAKDNIFAELFEDIKSLEFKVYLSQQGLMLDVQYELEYMLSERAEPAQKEIAIDLLQRLTDNPLKMLHLGERCMQELIDAQEDFSLADSRLYVPEHLLEEVSASIIDAAQYQYEDWQLLLGLKLLPSWQFVFNGDETSIFDGVFPIGLR